MFILNGVIFKINSNVLSLEIPERERGVSKEASTYMWNGLKQIWITIQPNIQQNISTHTHTYTCKNISTCTENSFKGLRQQIFDLQLAPFNGMYRVLSGRCILWGGDVIIRHLIKRKDARASHFELIISVNRALLKVINLLMKAVFLILIKLFLKLKITKY